MSYRGIKVFEQINSKESLCKTKGIFYMSMDLEGTEKKLMIDLKVDTDKKGLETNNDDRVTIVSNLKESKRIQYETTKIHTRYGGCFTKS